MGDWVKPVVVLFQVLNLAVYNFMVLQCLSKEYVVGASKNLFHGLVAFVARVYTCELMNHMVVYNEKQITLIIFTVILLYQAITFGHLIYFNIFSTFVRCSRHCLIQKIVVRRCHCLFKHTCLLIFFPFFFFLFNSFVGGA